MKSETDWDELQEERQAIKALADSGRKEAIPKLAKIAGNHHKDQHNRILAIEVAERLTGQDVLSLIREHPGFNCKFVRRFAERRKREMA